jgi:predicted RNA-binding protein with PIN domain
MPTHLLIDGYNILKRSTVEAFLDGADLESARRYLLEKLAEYARQKRVRVTVVFDATLGLSLARQKEGYRGVAVVFSKQGETADQVMIEAIRKKPSGLAVVTSDRAIIDEAKKHGIPFVTPDRLERAMAGDIEEESERTEKKGNPRKAPKNVRKAHRAIRKI